MKKISIVLALAVLFTACIKDVSVVNPLSENRVINVPYYFMGAIKTNFALDSSWGYKDSNGYYNEDKSQGYWRTRVEAVKFLPQYRSTGTIRTRFLCSKLGIDTITVLQDYRKDHIITQLRSGYFNSTDTSKNVWNWLSIKNSSKVVVNDTVVVYAVTSWIQPLQTVTKQDSIRIIFK